MPESEAGAPVGTRPPRQSEAAVAAGDAGRGGVFRTFSSLAYRDYRLLWIGQLGWSGALWIEMIARNWLVWQMTGSGLSLGLINLARALPNVALALPAGVMADRFNKKRVLQVAQGVNLACYVALFALVATGAVRLWHLYLFASAMGVAMAFNQPARQSLVPRLVPREALLNAVSLNQVAMNTTRVLGPAVAGLLIGFLGVPAAYGVAAGVFVLVVVTTTMLRASEGRSLSSTASARGQLLEGLVFVARNRSILAVMVVALVAFTFVMPYNTLMPMVADRVLGIGAQGYGLLLSLAGAGALAGGLFTASLGAVKRTSLLFLGGAFAFGVSVILLGAAPWVWLVVAAMPLVGASQSVFMSAGNTALLSRTPQELHGRVMSVYALDHGLMPLGSTLAGALADATSAPVALVAMGCAAAGLVVAVGAVSPSARRL